MKDINCGKKHIILIIDIDNHFIKEDCSSFVSHKLPIGLSTTDRILSYTHRRFDCSVS